MQEPRTHDMESAGCTQASVPFPAAGSRRRGHRLTWLLSELPRNPTEQGSFMIRPTHPGGVRLRSLAIGFLMFAPLAAAAAGGGFTDRIIVKYRTTADTASAAATQMRGTDLPAARFGVAMSRVRTTALGSQVLKLD